jgi:hypothetical protein
LYQQSINLSFQQILWRLRLIQRWAVSRLTQVTLLQTVNRARLQLMCLLLLHWMMPLRLHQRWTLPRLIRWLMRSVVQLTVGPLREHHLLQSQPHSPISILLQRHQNLLLMTRLRQRRSRIQLLN